MNEPAYIGVFLKEHMFAAMRFENQEDIKSELIDSLHDQGLSLKAITENEYKSFNGGDEISAKDLIQAWEGKLD